MRWHLDVDAGNAEFDVSHDDHICLLGSCFATNISDKLENSGFKVSSNPFGVVFNPLSLAFAMTKVKRAAIRVGESSLGFHAMDAHGSFVHADKDMLYSLVENRQDVFLNKLNESEVLIVTFGTAQVWEWREDQKPVANCHRIPQDHFDSRFLGVDEIVNCWKAVLEDAFSRNSNLKVVFTVSPVRYTRGGMVNNSLSKGILHLASRKLVELFENTYYFPAFEIVNDELRDHRFFKEDLVHPNEAAINYVYQKFQSWLMTPSTITKSEEVLRLNKRLDHHFANEEEAQNTRQEVNDAIALVLSKGK